MAVHDARPDGRVSCLGRAFRSVAAGWSMVPACWSWLGNFLRLLVGAFKGSGALVAKGRMSTYAIVEDFDVFENRGFGFVMSAEMPTIDQFYLERFPETFDAGVIVAVAASTHADAYAVVTESFAIRMARILATTIAMMNQIRSRRALTDGHIQST